ncbi:MAG: NADH:flavin oxidoreductase [Proteobacteria bacterium]|nr:NADH:flavin oxidoreductase [Pseudomonadota bacterium]
MKKIFEEVHLPHLTLKNRLVRSATWEAAANRDGSMVEEAFGIYDELARGGIGCIITGFTSVSDDDVYFKGMMRLSRDELISSYRRLVSVIHAHDCKVIAQLALGAYYRRLDNGMLYQTEPDEMTTEEIRTLIQQFTDAARRADEAGFDGVQIHAAHFFFLSRFISPAVNHRNDIYGGTTQNRSRILCEILESIRKVAPDLHITIKINSSDFTAGGLDEEESLQICKILSEHHIDSIEVSGNGTSVRGIRAGVNEGYFASFASRLAKEIHTPVIVVGGFRSRSKMDEILSSTEIALISLSRPLLREPDLPNLMLNGKSNVSKCVSCNACYSSHLHKCIFR